MPKMLGVLAGETDRRRTGRICNAAH